MLRPGVVWFGDVLPEGAMDRAAPAGLVPLAKAAIEIDPEATDYSNEVAFSICGTAAQVLPKLFA